MAIQELEKVELRKLHIREDKNLKLPDLDFLKQVFYREKINAISISVSYKKDKSFINEFSEVIYLYIRPITNFKDIEVLYTFKNLKYLNLNTLHVTKSAQKFFYPASLEHYDLIIDFSNFKKLETLFLGGTFKNKNINNLNYCNSIKTLFIEGYKDKDLEIFSGLLKAKHLTINSSSIKTLKGIEKLENLEYLSLENLRSLRDISHISKLKKLKELTIDTCSKIYDYEALSGIENLEEIDISNNRDIKDLKFLSHLKKLRLFRMGQSSNVVDGDLSYTDNIEKAYFPSRKHYNR